MMPLLRRVSVFIALLGATLGASCPPRPQLPKLNIDVPPSLLCPRFPAGIPIRTMTLALPTPASRALRRSGSFLGNCSVSRSVNWQTSPPGSVIRVGSYVDDCGTTDESSAHVTFNLSDVAAAVAAMPPSTCRVISATADFSFTTRAAISSASGETPNCVGSVHRATNAQWLTIPSEDHRGNQFLGASSTFIDPSVPELPIHVPPRAGEPRLPTGRWGIQPGLLSVDLTDAMQRWVDRGTANDGLLFFPQSANGPLNAAKAPGAVTAACVGDLTLVRAVVILDAH